MRTRQRSIRSLPTSKKNGLKVSTKGTPAQAQRGCNFIDNPDGKGSGRWADDLMNNMSDVTGLEIRIRKSADPTRWMTPSLILSRD